MNRKEKFEDLQLDFYRWMIDFGGVRQGTRNNYISWLKFLSEFYDIDYSITKEYIDFVIESENKNRIGRKQYSRSGDLSNFKSALRKFMGFVNSDYEKKYADRVLAEIKKIESEIKRLENFLTGVEKKLSNERFVSNAPAQVVELERKKQSDATTKLASLRENLKSYL